MRLSRLWWAAILVCTCTALLPFAQGDNDVILKSMTLYNKHEWFGDPRIYVRCNEGDKIFLPDVITENHLYTFTGHESFQPVVELDDEQCRRCGVYEADTMKADDVLGEWELCPLDFGVDGTYLKAVTGEFSALLYCKHCYKGLAREEVDDDDDDDDESKGKGLHPAGNQTESATVSATPQPTTFTSANATTTPVFANTSTSVAPQAGGSDPASSGASFDASSGDHVVRVTSDDSGGRSTALVLVLVLFVGALVGAAVSAGVIYYLKWKRRKEEEKARTLELLYGDDEYDDAFELGGRL